ncbi:putative pentatricopeptide repeat-containing protein [Citrus sinensis]|nr:putative pentatricopeptide repeat-containing protein [Citrus sinensis]
MATRTQFRCLFSSETVSKVKLSSLFKSPRQIAAVSSPETQLNEFLHENCKLGIINLNEARYFFGYMTHMQPSPPISSFNLLFGAVAKNRHYDAVISFYRKLVSIGLLPDFLTLNILINCFGNKERVYAVTFNSLIKGLCVENRIKEATWLFKNMIAFGVRPDVITYGTLINGFCRTGNLSVALRLHKKMVSGDYENGLISKTNIFSYSIIIDSLCKEGLVDKAKELFLEMKGRGINPAVVVCTTLIHGFCCAGNWEEVNGLFIEMLDLGPRPNLLTFNVMIDCLCKGGKINEANGLLELMIQRGLNPDRFTYNSLMDGYCLVGRIDTAREIFLSMHSKGCKHTVVSYNILINGYCKILNVEESLQANNI